MQATELGKKFMDKHPKMVALSEQMAEVRKAVIGEVQRVIASLENQYNTLTAQENELKQLFNTQKSTVIQSEKDVTTYEALRRDLDIQKAMYQKSPGVSLKRVLPRRWRITMSPLWNSLDGIPVPSGQQNLLFGCTQPGMRGRPRVVGRGTR